MEYGRVLEMIVEDRGMKRKREKTVKKVIRKREKTAKTLTSESRSIKRKDENQKIYKKDDEEGWGGELGESEMEVFYVGGCLRERKVVVIRDMVVVDRENARWWFILFSKRREGGNLRR